MAETNEVKARRSWLDWLETRFNLTETVAFLSSFGLFPIELDIRKPLREAIREAVSKPMPSYLRFPRVLGVLTAQLFVFLVLTGIMLALYYHPTTEEAATSIQTITRDVSFGWLVHQSHLWAGRALVVVLLIRLLRFFFQGVYKSPREGLWVVVAATYALACAAHFTGHLLAWDASGYWSTVRGVEALESMPLLGSVFVFFVGGLRFDSLTLVRFYALHAALIPAALGLLFHLNAMGVRRVGLAARTPSSESTSSFRAHAINGLILSLVLFGVIISLATLFPAPFGAVADPFSTPAGARPPVYLLAAHAVIEGMPDTIPRIVRGLIVELGLLVIVLLPFLDRAPWRPARERLPVLVAGVLVVVLLAWLTWHGYMLEAAS